MSDRAGIDVRALVHAMRTAILVVALAGMIAALNPVPAAAHIIGTGGSPTNYQTMVTAIRPAVPTVGVTVGLGGQWVRVTNQSATTIVILGYHGEPFLRLTQNRVQVNELSATAVETGLTRGVPPSPHPAPADPAPADPTAGPRWVGVTDGDNATWSDVRIGAQAPGSWELPLIVDGQRVTVLGTRDLIPPPSPWPWLAVLVLCTVAVVALGRRRDWHRPMAAVVAVGMLAFVIHVLGTGFTPQQNGRIFGWVGVSAIGAFSLLIGGITIVSTVRRSVAAPDRLVTYGAMVLLLAATDISVLWYSQVPFAGPALLDRVLTVLIYASALGLLLAGLRLVRAARSTRLREDG
jgi:hypothetical protein